MVLYAVKGGGGAVVRDTVLYAVKEGVRYLGVEVGGTGRLLRTR